MKTPRFLVGGDENPSPVAASSPSAAAYVFTLKQIMLYPVESLKTQVQTRQRPKSLLGLVNGLVGSAAGMFPSGKTELFLSVVSADR